MPGNLGSVLTRNPPLPAKRKHLSDNRSSMALWVEYFGTALVSGSPPWRSVQATAEEKKKNQEGSMERKEQERRERKQRGVSTPSRGGQQAAGASIIMGSGQHWPCCHRVAVATFVTRPPGRGIKAEHGAGSCTLKEHLAESRRI